MPKQANLYFVAFSGKTFTTINQSHRQQSMLTTKLTFENTLLLTYQRNVVCSVYALHWFSNLESFMRAQLGRSYVSVPPSLSLSHTHTHTHTHTNTLTLTHTHTNTHGHSHKCVFHMCFIPNRMTCLWHSIYCYITVTTRQVTQRQ